MELKKIVYVEILIWLIKVSLSLGNWSFTKVFRDKALDGNSLFVLENLTEWQCLFESSNEPRSGSVNYHKEYKICVVNTVVDKEETELKMKVQQGWTYYEKETKQYNYGETIHSGKGFYHNKELQLEKDKILTIIKHWHTDWFVSFKIQPHSVLGTWSSIFHFTIDGNHGTHGFRCPAFFFAPATTQMFVAFSANGNKNVQFNFPVPLHDVTSFYIEQSVLSAGTHAIKISINGTVVEELINTDARIFQNVLVYGSSPWHLVANATISDFQIGYL